MCDPAPPPASNHAGAILQNLHKNKTIKSTEEKEASDKAFHPHPVTRFGNVSVKKSADKYGGAVPAQAATTALSAAAAAAPAPSSLASVAMSKPAAQVRPGGGCPPALR